MMIQMEHVACMREMRNAYRILVWKPEENSPLGIPRPKCKYNIKMDLKDIGLESIHWMYLAYGKNQRWDLVNTLMYFRVP